MKISLRAARVNAGMTAEDVAKALGVSKATVCAWERGAWSLKISNFAELCRMYGVGLDDIIVPEKSTEK